MTDEARRRVLAEFLRTRRDRVQPADAGIPAGPRRRTPGLRREEVAVLSGVSVTWYTWLEQARDITVSRQVLHSLAGVLRLSPAETRHLFDLAGHTLPRSTGGDFDGRALRRLVDALDPHPAYLLAPNWDLLARNRAETGLIGDPADGSVSEHNLLRLVFTHPRIRTLLVDWPGQARALLEQYRAGADRHTGDPAFERLTAGLYRESDEFRSWWETHDVAEFRPARRTFDHPRLGRLTFDYVKLAVVDAPGVTLVSCLPADDRTAAKLPELSRCAPHPPTAPRHLDDH
ncbi:MULTISPECIES: helix-turn-helix transcriptional regulator [unclassified Streptomyces]|uniref:helix-turn-helix transcriptional regulator n=1 Tax=unclassified Streptomyces TaxID=2593676 RepID=UPI00081B7E81|nr:MULTISPECIES: helix-turn-helix transcriptional regulator [unclassified Streptomyces]MYQ84290.1 helix-turn-helix domain-containing protein [Streptomyces sp. SID4936]SCD83345.1 Helix-turn-helix domain-containing protein [Streptomyces sp. DvalAA-43]